MASSTSGLISLWSTFREGEPRVSSPEHRKTAPFYTPLPGNWREKARGRAQTNTKKKKNLANA